MLTILSSFAEIDGKIVGLIDVENEIEEGKVCYYNSGLGGIIWHLAVLPEQRNRGISTFVLNKAIEILKPCNLTYRESPVSSKTYEYIIQKNK